MRLAAEETVEHRLTLPEVLNALIADGHVRKEDAEPLMADRRLQRPDHHPLVVIADQKWKSAQPPHKLLHIDALTEWMASKVGMPYFHIDPLKINVSAVTEVVSNAYATRFKILSVDVDSKEAVLATAEPYIREYEKELRQALKLEIRRVIANPADIARYITEFYNLARSIKKATGAGKGAQSGLGNFEQLVEMGKGAKQFDANDQHIVNIVDWLWQYAIEQRASDIHIEPRRDLGIVRFRIDGVLHQVYQIPMVVMVAMTSRIKLLGRMDVIEKRRPQDGRIKTKTGDQEVELRLSTLPTALGEKQVKRIFDPEVLVKDFTELGFSDEDYKRWTKMTASPNGIVLVTGPTGSGKTTTLYSSLKQLATPEVNVCTIEDPIEMVEPAFNQMQVLGGIDISFAEGVRALMRQDPDIIMVGEIRDLETAEMAIQAALTGHLVLSTLHTNDSASAITRLLDLGVAPYLISATVLGVMAQRLVRTLCPHCKKKVAREGTRESDALWDELVAPWKASPPAALYYPVGCLECRNTGFRGRAGIYEILTLTPAIKALITRDADLAKIREQAYKDGMKSLRISGAMKINIGQTTLEEVLKAAPPASMGG